MAGYLQRFFEGAGLAMGSAAAPAAAPAHRPASPLFTPDQQIAHTGFDRSEQGHDLLDPAPQWSAPAEPREAAPTPTQTFADPLAPNQRDSSNRRPDIASPISQVPHPILRPSHGQELASPELDRSQFSAAEGPSSRSAEPLNDDSAHAKPKSPKTPPLTTAPPLALETKSRSEILQQEPSQPEISEAQFRATPLQPAEPRNLRSPAPLSPSEPDLSPQTQPIESKSRTDTAPLTLPSRTTASPAQRNAESSAEPAPLAQAIPFARSPEPIPQSATPQPDWKGIEARVDAMVREKAAEHTRRSKDAATNQSTTAPDSQSTSPRPSNPPRPMTAAEASVIGKIGAAKRPTMIFGTRLR